MSGPVDSGSAKQECAVPRPQGNIFRQVFIARWRSKALASIPPNPLVAPNTGRELFLQLAVQSSLAWAVTSLWGFRRPRDEAPPPTRVKECTCLQAVPLLFLSQGKKTKTLHWFPDCSATSKAALLPNRSQLWFLWLKLSLWIPGFSHVGISATGSQTCLHQIHLKELLKIVILSSFSPFPRIQNVQGEVCRPLRDSLAARRAQFHGSTLSFPQYLNSSNLSFR